MDAVDPLFFSMVQGCVWSVRERLAALQIVHETWPLRLSSGYLSMDIPRPRKKSQFLRTIPIMTCQDWFLDIYFHILLVSNICWNIYSDILFDIDSEIYLAYPDKLLAFHLTHVFFWHLFWQYWNIFWHSIWHVFWISIRYMFWQSICYIL